MEISELAHLRRARDLLEREYARPLNVPAMARAVLMSPSLFSRRFREAYSGAKPIILEPIMKVEIEAPVEFQGSVVGQVNQRRGMIQDTISSDTGTVTALVPLNTMFGYSTDLRSATQGKGTFTMEFARYSIVPKQEQEEMTKKYRETLAAEAARK